MAIQTMNDFSAARQRREARARARAANLPPSYDGLGALPGPAAPQDDRTRGRSPQLGFTDNRQRSLARALGWFSIGLGVVQLVAPRRMSRMIGVAPRPVLMRLLGAREIASGMGILKGRQPGHYLWSRVAGDGMDMALLGRALLSDRSNRLRVAGTAAVAFGIGLLDTLASQQVSRHPRAELPQAPGDGLVRVQTTIAINREPQECYAFFRDFSNLPRFMQHVESIRVDSETRSHWIVKAPAGATVEWDAEVTHEQPGEAIAWKTLPGADVHNHGVVRFSPGPGGRGTTVRLQLEYRPPGGPLATFAAKAFGEEPEQQAQEDLRRFKRVMEVGEVPTTEGQSAGHRSAVARVFSKVSP